MKEIIVKQLTNPIEILLVEDSPADQLIATEALQQARLLNNVHAVSDGDQALAFLRRENKFQDAPRPDLILLDLSLPGKDGREVLAAIKTDPSLKLIPVVLLTTSKAHEDVLKAFRLPANYYIAKPVDFTKFINVLLTMEEFWFQAVTLSPEDSTGEKFSSPLPAPDTHRLDEIGQLAGAVAHDFNNLLMVIQGYARELSAAGETSGPALEILNAAVRAEGLTRQLLALSRRQVVQLKDVNMHEIVAQASSVLKHTLPENIRLQIQDQTDLPLLQADAGLIEQIILCLAANARDAMPTGGTLILSTGSRTIGKGDAKINPDAAAGAFVFISVSDSGIGIDPEILPRIFAPFFTTKSAGQRTGLGLAAVHDIVKQHNGWIDVTSKIGEGTTFRIYFPAAKIAAATTVAKPVNQGVATPRGTETILVVEDEFHIRALVSSILRRFGYNVIEASQSTEADEVWAKNRDAIQLLFTDVMMPGGVTGLQVAERLQADKPELKVILTSGYSPDIFGESASPLEPGQIFLQKPYSPDVLLRIIRQTLDAN